ncbi:MAG TPA: hypothetical protein VGL35_08025 [Rhizomicrobium sp.]
MRPDRHDRRSPEIIKHSGWVLPAAVLAAIGAVCALFLLYYLAPEPTALIEEHVSPTALVYPVHLKIGAISFVVPANYLPYESERTGGPRERLVVYAELPDFRGYSAEKQAELTETRARMAVIHILIRKEEFDVTEPMRLQRIYLKEVIDRRGREGPFGLIQYSFRKDSGYRGEDLFVGRGRDGQIVMRCTRTGPEVPPPNCLREILLAPEVSLSYRFPRPDLADWRSIARGVSHLVASFRSTRH